MNKPNSLNKLTVPSPAKLNLLLHITGRRDDGYHNLQTLFQFLDYGDELTFENSPQNNNILLSPDFKGVATEENLIYRAALALKQFTGYQGGAQISVAKHLPMGGGLGGGSSNAATTLIALNHLWDTKLSLTQLADIGLKLGADVPVFVHGKAAWGEGVGEQLFFVDDVLETPWYVVLKPEDCFVSTARIFTEKNLTRNSEAIIFSPALKHGGRNDCSEVVRKLYPRIDEALHWLEVFAPARITGTGACIFASFESRATAQRVLDSAPAYLSGFVAKGLNRSSLHTVLDL